MTWKVQLDEQTRVRCERERRERIQKLIERRSETIEEHSPKLDIPSPHPVSLERIDERIMAYHEERLTPLLTGVVAKVLDSGADELNLALRRLKAEIAELRAALAELRATFFSEKADKSVPVDLPKLPLRN